MQAEFLYIFDRNSCDATGPSQRQVLAAALVTSFWPARAMAALFIFINGSAQKPVLLH